jgi:hypothetical protein
LRPTESFRDYSTLSAHAAIENLRDIPARFPKEELRAFITEYFQSGIKNDPELSKLVKQVEEGETLSGGRPSLIALLSKFVKRYDEQLDNTVKAQMTKFLNSDLPFSVFDQLSMFNRTYAKFLPTVAEASRRMHTRVASSHRSRGIRGSAIPLEDFKKKISPLLISCDFAWLSYFGLNLYLEVTHSERLQDLFQPKPFELKRLNPQEFNRLVRELSVHNDEFRESLITYGLRGTKPRVPKVSVPVYTAWQEMNDFLTAQA